MNYCAFAGAFERGENVEQECVVAILLRRDAKFKPLVEVVRGIEAVAPRFGGERKIGDDEIKRFEAAVCVFLMRRRKRVIIPNGGSGAIMENHVHPGQRGSGVVHFLPVNRHVHRRFVMCLEQQRGRAAGGVVNRLIGTLGVTNTVDLGHDAGDLGGGEELPLALAGFNREMAHQVFVGIPHDVVALGAVAAEVERWVVEDGDQIGESVNHVLALAEFVGVVEIGNINHTLEVIGFRELADDLVDFVADFLVALERDHVGKTAALGNVEQVVLLTGGLIGDVFHEQQDEDVILVLRSVHPPAQFVATCPEGGIKFRFLDCHGGSLLSRPKMSVTN